MINEKKRRAVIVSPDIYDETANTLKQLGWEILFSFENNNVSEHLKYHADMQIAQVNDSTYVCAPECYAYYKNILKDFNKNVVCGNTFLSCNYPDDIAYNIIITNSCAVHNYKYTDSVIKNIIAEKKLINVSQGYCACTLCPLGDEAFITSDKGLYKTLISCKYDVLLIDDSSILLPGFDHGFFGGASVMLQDDLLAVNGDIALHPDFNSIKSFCADYGINILSLSDKAVMDIGSFILI